MIVGMGGINLTWWEWMCCFFLMGHSGNMRAFFVRSVPAYIFFLKHTLCLLEKPGAPGENHKWGEWTKDDNFDCKTPQKPWKSMPWKPYTELSSHIPNEWRETQQLKIFLNQEKMPLFFFFPFFFGSVSSENQTTFKTSAVLQNAQQFRRRWRWMLLTTCGWVLRCLRVTVGVSHCGLWLCLVQSRLKTKHTQEKVRVLFVWMSSHFEAATRNF